MSAKDAKEKDIAFIERLNEVIQDAGGIAELSLKTEISKASIEKYRRGTDPSRTFLNAMAKAAGVSIEWLAAGNGEKHPGVSAFVAVPVLPSLHSSQALGVLAFDQIGDAFPLSRIWAERWGISERSHCVVWGIEGMEPTISPHDKLICHMTPSCIKGDGLFLLRYGDVHTVKRLQWQPDKIRATSDDERFGAYDLPLDTDTIIGRVFMKADFKRV